MHGIKKDVIVVNSNVLFHHSFVGTEEIKNKIC
jgi:hypothetical protein